VRRQHWLVAEGRQRRRAEQRQAEKSVCVCRRCHGIGSRASGSGRPVSPASIAGGAGVRVAAAAIAATATATAPVAVAPVMPPRTPTALTLVVTRAADRRQNRFLVITPTPVAVFNTAAEAGSLAPGAAAAASVAVAVLLLVAEASSAPAAAAGRFIVVAAAAAAVVGAGCPVVMHRPAQALRAARGGAGRLLGPCGSVSAPASRTAR